MLFHGNFQKNMRLIHKLMRQKKLENDKVSAKIGEDIHLVYEMILEINFSDFTIARFHSLSCKKQHLLLQKEETVL